MEPSGLGCLLLFIFSSLVTTLPIEGENPHGENCSCVTKEEVYDLWGRVTALESFMNETEVFEDDLIGSTSNSTMGPGELGYTNNTASDGGTVDFGNGNSGLTVENASQKEDNGASRFTHLEKHVSETTVPLDSDNYTSATDSNRYSNSDISSTDDALTSTISSTDDALTSTVERNIQSITESIDYHNVVRKDHSRLSYNVPESETDSLFSEALSGSTQQIKLNHTLLTAIYSSILSLKDRINYLNATVQNLMQEVKTESHGHLGIVESNKISQMLEKEGLITESPSGPSLKADGPGSEMASFAETIKLVAAMEERLNLLDGLVRSQVQQGNSGSFTSKDACEGPRKHRIGSSCYSVPKLKQGSKLFTWWDARFWCKDNLGTAADLATINDDNEMQQVIFLLNNHFGDIEEFWLGGNDLVQEGDWRWIANDRPVGYSHWRDGAPPGDQFKNCMSMLAGRQWVAEPCYFDRYPLCELQL